MGDAAVREDEWSARPRRKRRGHARWPASAAAGDQPGGSCTGQQTREHTCEDEPASTCEDPAQFQRFDTAEERWTLCRADGRVGIHALLGAATRALRDPARARAAVHEDKL